MLWSALGQISDNEMYISVLNWVIIFWYLQSPGYIFLKLSNWEVMDINVWFHNGINVSIIWVCQSRYFFDLRFWFFNLNWWWWMWSFLCAFWLLNMSCAVCSLEVVFSLTWKNAVMLWHPSATLLWLFLFHQSLIWVSSIYHTPPCFKLGQLVWFHLWVASE